MQAIDKALKVFDEVISFRVGTISHMVEIE